MPPLLLVLNKLVLVPQLPLCRLPSLFSLAVAPTNTTTTTIASSAHRVDCRRATTSRARVTRPVPPARPNQCASTASTASACRRSSFWRKATDRLPHHHHYRLFRPHSRLQKSRQPSPCKEASANSTHRAATASASRRSSRCCYAADSLYHHYHHHQNRLLRPHSRRRRQKSRRQLRPWKQGGQCQQHG